MRFVSYYRVSTTKQGKSGLGLEAQQETVRHYLERIDGDVIGAYTEIESGSHADRPQLQLALEQCHQAKATLLIAKLDRLSRDAGFLMTLRNAGVDIRAADMPEAGTLEFGIRAIFAQHEREEISRRTKEALAAAKARGVQLGSPRARETIRKARESRMKAANKQAIEFYWPIIASIQAAGLKTLREVAGALNARGIPSPGGRQWHPTAVKRVLERVSAAETLQAAA